MTEYEDGSSETRNVHPGNHDLPSARSASLDPYNVETGTLRILACHEFPRPEAALRAAPGCTVIAPGSA